MSYLKAKNPNTSDLHKIVDVLVDNSGRLVMVTAAGAGLECKICDDAASGGPYFILSDTDGKPLLANHTALTNSNRVEEIDPVSEHYVSETLAEITNGADATYYYYTDMAGYKHWGLQAILDCIGGTVTATVEATCQDDGTAQASCSYLDVTNDWFGVANLQAAAGSAEDIWLAENVPGACKYVRVKIVANTAGATGDWTLFHKRLF